MCFNIYNKKKNKKVWNLILKQNGSTHIYGNQIPFLLLIQTKIIIMVNFFNLSEVMIIGNNK
jgi:hypothetical protein